MIKIFFDVETTGVDVRKHSIHQLAGLVEVDNEVVESFDFRIRPHPKAAIEPEALKVGGVTLEQIMAYPSMEEQHKQFKKLLKKYIDPFDRTQKAWLVGFNNRYFDDVFLRYFFELCGDNYIGSWFWSDTIDVLCLASEYLTNRRSKMKSFKLQSVAEELGIRLDGQFHDARFDCLITRQIYRIVTYLEFEF